MVFLDSQEEQACAAAAKTWAVKLEELIDATQELYDIIMGELKEQHVGPKTYKVEVGIGFVTSSIKVRMDMKPKLRENACHRLDSVMVSLLKLVVDQVTGEGDLDWASIGSTAIEDFCAMAQEYVGFPILSSSLAGLHAWKQDQQQALNKAAMQSFLEASKSCLSKDFDIHECQRLIDNLSVDQKLTEQEHMFLSGCVLGHLCHQAATAACIHEAVDCS